MDNVHFKVLQHEYLSFSDNAAIDSIIYYSISSNLKLNFPSSVSSTLTLLFQLCGQPDKCKNLKIEITPCFVNCASCEEQGTSEDNQKCISCKEGRSFYTTLPGKVRVVKTVVILRQKPMKNTQTFIRMKA